MANEIVRDVEHLKELSKDDYAEFYIMLAGGMLRSSKTIKWDGEKFCINNEIDGSHQCLKPASLWKRSNIGEALDKHALIYEGK